MNKTLKKHKTFDYTLTPCNNMSECYGNLLYIHGFNDTYSSHDLAKELSEHFNYYALNLPGHSEKIPAQVKEMNLKNYEKYVSDFIRSENLTNLLLIGHSMAGVIVPSVSIEFIDKIFGIILVAPSNLGCVYNSKYLKKILNLDSIKDKQLMLDAIYYDSKNYSKSPVYNLDEKNIKSYWNYINIKQFKYLAKDLKKVRYSLFYNPFNLWLIKRSHLPIMVFLGAHDKMIPLKPSINFFESFKNDKMSIAIFENSGHMIFQEQKEAYIKEIFHFAQKIKNNWI